MGSKFFYKMKTISELISSMIGVTRLSLVIVIQRDDAQTDPADLAVANLGQDGHHQVVLVPLPSAPGTRHAAPSPNCK